MSDMEFVTDRPVPSSFAEILEEIYQGEAGGEAFFCEMLARFREPDQQYKLGSLLQLETELKAKIRPLAFKHGVEIVEDQDSKRQIAELAIQFDGQSWDQFIQGFAQMMPTFVDRFRMLGAAMPADQADLAAAVVEHEESIEEFARLEAAGSSEQSIDRVVRQLIHPLPSP
jgi:AcrR family transcriptional regulator